MNNSANVIVNILVNAQSAQAGVSGFGTIINQITVIARQAATSAASSFNSIFGANFFANLASSMVQSFTAGFRQFVNEAINAASRFESAFVGLSSTARNLGFSATDVVEAVRGIDLVRNGLLTVQEAATATKNLLASGFSLPQSIELIKRFGDTAAFGRQAALSFGYAISSATEGIKNQNSVLVDNAGVTKNLSVILKERGFQIQDISDKVKGAAAREALYQGLLKETSIQQGDAAKLLDTTQGSLVRVGSAYERFLAALGETVTKSSVVKSALSVVVSLLDTMAKNTGTTALLATSLIALSAAAALSTTNFTALTLAQISNAVAGSGVVKMIQTAILVMTNFQYITALTAGEIAILSGGFLAIAGLVAAFAFAVYNAAGAQAEQAKVSKEGAIALQQQKDGYVSQIAVLETLNASTLSFGQKQVAITAAYRGVNIETQERIVRLDAEAQKAGQTGQATDVQAEKIRVLTEEYRRLNLEQDKRLLTQERLTTAGFVSKLDSLNQQDAAQKRAAAEAERLQLFINSQAGLGSASKAGTETFYQKKQADLEFGRLGEAMQTTAKEAKDLYDQMELLAKNRGTDIESLIRQKYAFEGNAAGADSAVAAYRRFVDSQNLGVAATQKQTDAITDQINELRKLAQQSDTSAVVSARRKIIGDVQTRIANQAGGDINRAKQLLEEAKTGLKADDGTQFGSILKDQQDFEKVNRELDKLFSPKPERARKVKSEFESLSDSLRKLRGEVQSYTDLTSKTFRLRFEKEELERTKRDFEAIIDLRRELGRPLDSALPSTAGGARAEKETLERVKNLRDEVLKVNREVQDSDDKLLLARITAAAAVTDAQTRADTAYLNGLRARRDAEAQLTADIALEMRKRADSAADYQRTVEQAQAEAFGEFLKAETARDNERLKDIAKIQILFGDVFQNNPIVNAAAAISNAPKPDVSPVVGRLDTSNDLLQKILDAVKTSELGGSSSFSSSGAVSGKNSQGNAIVRAANALGVSPVDLAAIIGYETAGSFSPQKVGGKNNAYRGLIQFGAPERKQFGVTENQSFENQVETSVVKYFQTRFASVGRSTEGATLLDLYKTVNGGNPNVSSNASDGFRMVNGRRVRNTIAGHVEKIARQYIPLVSNRFFNFGEGSQQTAPAQLVGGAALALENLNGGGNSVQIPTATRPRVNQLASFVGDYFGLKDASQKSLDTLSPKQTAALKDYAEAQREFNENSAAQVISADRVSQALNVQFKQVRESEVAEARYNRLLAGDSISVREAVRESEIQRTKAAEATLSSLIQTNAYLEKLRAGDSKVFAQLITADDEDRAKGTAKAFEDIAKATAFLSGYASGDSKIAENLAKTREATRALELKSGTIDVDNLKAQAAAGGRDFQTEKIALEKEYFTTIVEVGKTEARIEQQRELRANPNYVAALRRNDVLSEQLQIEGKLSALEDERANLPLNQTLRERLAIEEELSAIYRDQFEAGEDAARARVRIADLSVYHEGRANARVLEHIAGMKSLTEIYSDAKIAVVDKVWGGLDTLFGKLTNKIPFVGGILKDMLSNLTKLILNPLLMRLLGLGTATTSGGGTGGGASAAGTIFSGGGGGGTPPFVGNFASGGSSASGGNPFVQLLSNQAGAGGGARSNLFDVIGASGSAAAENTRPFLDDLATIRGNSSAAGGQLGGAAQQAGGGVLQNLAKGINLKELKAGLANAAPSLGLGLGASLGGSSVGGQILGGAGGLLGGTLASGLLSGGVFGAGGSGLFGIAALSGAATLGIGFAVAGAALLGSYLIGRNSKRRKEEKERTAILGDAKSQLQKIIQDLRSGRTDSVSALTQAQAIRDSYLQQVGQLKDKKTRNIAIATVRELDVMIETIKTEGRRADFAQAQDEAFVPTFDGGGMFGYVRSVAASSRQSYNDTHVAAFNPNTEAILNRRDIYALGGYGRMKQAGVRGAELYAGGSSASTAAYSPAASNFGGSSGGGAADMPIHVFAVFDDESKDKLISKSSGKAIIKVVKVLVDAGQDEGLVDSFGSKLAGE